MAKGINVELRLSHRGMIVTALAAVLMPSG
jgi:hypothetical protein